jgi:hypothetical protein
MPVVLAPERPSPKVSMAPAQPSPPPQPREPSPKYQEPIEQPMEVTFSRMSSSPRPRSVGPPNRNKQSEYKENFLPWISPAPLHSVDPSPPVKLASLETINIKGCANGTSVSGDGEQVMATSLPSKVNFWTGDGVEVDHEIKEKRHFSGPTVLFDPPEHFWTGDGFEFDDEIKEKRHFSEPNVTNRQAVLFDPPGFIPNGKREIPKVSEYTTSVKPFTNYVYIQSEGKFKLLKDILPESRSLEGDDWKTACRERHECALTSQMNCEAGHPILGRETPADICRRTQHIPKNRA